MPDPQRRGDPVTAILRALMLLLLALGAMPAAAQDGPGFALVIGSGSYRAAPAVPMARDEAQLVAAGLRNAGLQVRAVGDLDAATLRQQVTALSQAIPAGGSALVYFRGHVVQAPARNRAEGLDNWLLGVDEAAPGPASVSLTELLDLLNAANVARQVIVLDAAAPIAGRPVGMVQPGAKALRRAVVLLGAAPGEAARPISGLGIALASTLANSNAPAGELMLQVADKVATRTGGDQRPLVLGSGASAQWVVNPKGSAQVATADAPDVAMVKRYREAIACGTKACLASGANAVRGDLRRDLERRLSEMTVIDDFDPGAVGGRRAARPLNAAQEGVVAAMSRDRPGQYRLGIWLLRGTPPMPQDADLAMTWLTEAQKFVDGPGYEGAAAWARLKAKFVLGWMYFTGHGVAKDVRRARTFWDPEDPDAAWYLALYVGQCRPEWSGCDASLAPGYYAKARAGGVTRARSPLDPDFPQEMPK